MGWPLIGGPINLPHAVDRMGLRCYLPATVLQQSTSDRGQVLQRVRVGLTGLTITVLLILAAAIVYRSASREEPAKIVGQANPDVVATMTAPTPMANATTDTTPDEPLATLGVTPAERPKSGDATTPPTEPQTP